MSFTCVILPLRTDFPVMLWYFLAVLAISWLIFGEIFAQLKLNRLRKVVFRLPSYGNVLFFGEFSYAGRCFAKYILYRADRVVVVFFNFCSVAVNWQVSGLSSANFKHHLLNEGWSERIRNPSSSPNS